MNPFKFGQIVKNKEFCPRPDLIDRLSSEIESGQNVFIQGERRLGKSSLIVETIRRLNKHRMAYIDLLECKTIDDLVKRAVMGLISSEKGSGPFNKILKTLSHLRPVVSFDTITNMPTISIDTPLMPIPDTITSVIDLITSYHKKNRPLVVVFDEFQDILKQKDAKQTIALMRSNIQFHSDISFIFSGSIRNQMDELFTSPDSAFFKSAIPLNIGPINREIFQNFILKKFKLDKRKIDMIVLNQVFELCYDVPGDIQQLCSSIWNITNLGDSIPGEIIPSALEQIFFQELKSYEATLNIVSGQQLKVLTGIARLGGGEVHSGMFLRNSGLTHISTIQTAIKRLLKLKLLYFTDKQYRFVNPFFRAWLLYKNL